MAYNPGAVLTVAELIQRLGDFPPDSVVLTAHYGYETLLSEDVHVGKVVKAPNPGWPEPRYMFAYTDDPAELDDGEEFVEVVLVEA